MTAMYLVSANCCFFNSRLIIKNKSFASFHGKKPELVGLHNLVINSGDSSQHQVDIVHPYYAVWYETYFSFFRRN